MIKLQGSLSMLSPFIWNLLSRVEVLFLRKYWEFPYFVPVYKKIDIDVYVNIRPGSFHGAVCVLLNRILWMSYCIKRLQKSGEYTYSWSF